MKMYPVVSFAVEKNPKVPAILQHLLTEVQDLLSDLRNRSTNTEKYLNALVSDHKLLDLEVSELAYQVDELKSKIQNVLDFANKNFDLYDELQRSRNEQQRLQSERDRFNALLENAMTMLEVRTVQLRSTQDQLEALQYSQSMASTIITAKEPFDTSLSRAQLEESLLRARTDLLKYEHALREAHAELDGWAFSHGNEVELSVGEPVKRPCIWRSQFDAMTAQQNLLLKQQEQWVDTAVKIKTTVALLKGEFTGIERELEEIRSQLNQEISELDIKTKHLQSTVAHQGAELQTAEAEVEAWKWSHDSSERRGRGRGTRRVCVWREQLEQVQGELYRAKEAAAGRETEWSGAWGQLEERYREELGRLQRDLDLEHHRWAAAAADAESQRAAKREMRARARQEAEEAAGLRQRVEELVDVLSAESARHGRVYVDALAALRSMML